MNTVIQPNNDFDFNNITIKTPRVLQGGTYAVGLLNNDAPIIIQLPKCNNKNGIKITGKKIYCDLIFNNNEFIEWFINFEDRIKELILQNSQYWFETPLEMEDIDENWLSTIKYKKKGYLIKTFIETYKKNNNIKIWDHNKNELTIHDIKSGDELINIIEITDLKFSEHSFQLHIFLRQTMIIKKIELFNKCLIQLSPNDMIDKGDNYDDIGNNNIKSNESIKVGNVESNDNIQEDNLEINDNIQEDNLESNDNIQEDNLEINDNIQEDNLESNDGIQVDNLESNEGIQVDNVESNDEYEKLDNAEVNIDKTLEKTTNISDTLEKNENNDVENVENIENILSNEGLIESDVDLINALEKKDNLLDVTNNIKHDEEDIIMELKQPKTIYLKLYYEAKKRAEEIKLEAIKAYLKANNIKKKYMLDELIEKSDNELNFNIQ